MKREEKGDIIFWGANPPPLERKHINNPFVHVPIKWDDRTHEIWALVKWTLTPAINGDWFIMLRAGEMAHLVSNESRHRNTTEPFIWRGRDGMPADDAYWYEPGRCLLVGWYNRTTGQLAFYAGA